MSIVLQWTALIRGLGLSHRQTDSAAASSVESQGVRGDNKCDWKMGICQALEGWRSWTRPFEPNTKGTGEPLKVSMQESDKSASERIVRKREVKVKNRGMQCS